MVALALLSLDNIKIYFLLKLSLCLEKMRIVNSGTCMHKDWSSALIKDK